MSFDPFGDFETRGYLRNRYGLKEPAEIKLLEHIAFKSRLADALQSLAPKEELGYEDVLRTHRQLFSTVYPWAGSDRLKTAPEVAVFRGGVEFAHPRDIPRAVNWALEIGNSVGAMQARPGEFLERMAYAHPFLDGNGRTMMTIYACLADRAGFSIRWPDIDRSVYLNELARVMDQPKLSCLDDLLRSHRRDALGLENLYSHLVTIPGLNPPGS